MSARAAFREAALGLMEWQNPPIPELHREVARYLEFRAITDSRAQARERRVWRPLSKQELAADGSVGYADPYDVEADWGERA